MKYLTIARLILMCGALCRAEDADANFFVSVEGSDSWSGTLAAANAQSNDGPFATLERARDAVRNFKEKTTSDIEVLVREGTYYLRDTVVFGVKDSGKDEFSVTYAAYPDEKPVFSSGWEITGWKTVGGEVPGLPEEAIGKVQVANVSGNLHAEGLCRAPIRKAFFHCAGAAVISFTVRTVCSKTGQMLKTLKLSCDLIMRGL